MGAQGGNPLLYPHFLELYRAACDRGFVTAILGNPAAPSYLEKITAIRSPAFFQVSLEGLRTHNDYIRGRGNFDNVMQFLNLLRTLSIPSQVMLTLTKDNLDQVLPLAEHLRGRADYFTYNRLAQVGFYDLPGWGCDYCSVTLSRDYVFVTDGSSTLSVLRYAGPRPSPSPTPARTPPATATPSPSTGLYLPVMLK